MPSQANHSTVTQSDSNQQALAARGRTVASFHNGSGSTVYLRLGSTAASLTAYTVAIANGGHYETPGSFDGAVQVIWAAAGAGLLQVTEVRA